MDSTDKSMARTSPARFDKEFNTGKHEIGFSWGGQAALRIPSFHYHGEQISKVTGGKQSSNVVSNGPWV